ncbi:hypothetical protein AAG906_034913 [Vitis piasezkii]|uniref:Uncharacterized protein n=1 Tax=Vitis vinifera TaxID=29760 RepID=A0A438KI93_VITVI|nr:hypothetical protein CK203_002772 [Vitis vinifera]
MAMGWGCGRLLESSGRSLEIDFTSLVNGKKVKFQKDRLCKECALEESFPVLCPTTIAKDSWVMHSSVIGTLCHGSFEENAEEGLEDLAFMFVLDLRNRSFKDAEQKD